MTQQQQLRSTVTSSGQLKLELAQIEVPAPTSNEVLVRVEASPINPSDLGLLFGMADMSTAKASGTSDAPMITADIAPNILKALTARLDQALPVGNEGGGVVVAAGDSELAQSMLGKTVGILGGAMYTQFRCVDAEQCLVMHEGTTSAEAASCFVNPLTALGMVETMKAEGHTALVHTAAASNLGQMLNKICIADGVQLVNIVRKQEQVDLLTAMGAQHVCNTSDDDFMQQLTDALVETGATIAFDATGGGPLTGQILTAMERAALTTTKEYSGYGSTTYKQVYIYGGLDRRPTEFNRAFGTAWGIGGWLLPPFLQKIGVDAAEALRQRVANEIKTTFASAYTAEVSLSEALTLEAITVYGKQATGEKYLINPSKGI
ncbi:MAG: zinc-binding dehydrogenase [Pseudomonadales bacterium]|nr:zinc-binding dehydrogenase [Gammaproteobacteria bacterium]MDG1304425.1 zinc-binding dehydrogenase [Pseudomonadales bacterium]MDG1834643.1 zinc-binding dehydrogenase [Pseudomonadales bacterium]